MSWKNNLQIYLDQALKSSHKEIYTELESLLSQMGVQVVFDKTELRQVQLPIIFFLSPQSLPDFAAFSVGLDHYIVKIESSNLDMFETQSSTQNFFTLNDVGGVVNLLDDLLAMIKLQINFKANELMAISNKNIKQIFSKKNIEHISSWNVWQQVQDFERLVYAINDSKALKDFLNNELSFFSQNGLKLLSLAEFLATANTTHFLVLPIDHEVELFLTWEKQTSEFAVMLFYGVLFQTLANQSLLGESRHLKKRLEKVLSQLPVALVVFDQEGEVIIHNGDFLQLGLSFKQCDQLENKEQITLGNHIFRVLKRKVENNQIEMMFLPVDDFLVENKNISSQELGIISSSIAHEINNPLAGILAAIDYLLIDDISDSLKSELSEMKQGIFRCQKLIQTFLGFSRVSKENSTHPLPAGEMGECLEQAMDLIRFRLIENNLQLHFDHNIKKQFSRPINPHVFSMLIYLVLGDLVTNISHHGLVIRKTHNPICLQFKEEENQLAMFLPEEIKLSEDFVRSKLVQHLLDINNLKIQSDKGSIILMSH